ncbi:MAG: hypothetical protein Q4D92_02145 [Slackia sp.]|nr:hypothetical protein [Slackia sp.]
MDFGSLYHFFFETFAGIGLLVGAGLVISVIACLIMEWKTRRTFKDRGPVEDEDDDFTFFDDED